MPHSVVPENESLHTLNNMDAPKNTADGEVQPVDTGDVDMEEADWSDSQRGDDGQEKKDPKSNAVEAGVSEVTVKAEKVDMKLADLFADMDSDEEFPSSNIKSSPPQPSSPPMYVHSSFYIGVS